MISKIKINMLLVAVICASCSMYLVQKKRKLYLAGDSTMSNKKTNHYPETGWGQVLGNYLNSNIQIINYAANGASTKSFIDQKKWQMLIDSVGKDDYVFIQFGHNDEHKDTIVGTSPKQYEANLIRFVKEVKYKNAIPVLLSPIMRRSILNGKFYNSHIGYAEVVNKVAISENVIFIDMLNASRELLEKIGVEESKRLFMHIQIGDKNYPNGKVDNTHLNVEGANEMAKLVIKEIELLKIPLMSYIQ